MAKQIDLANEQKYLSNLANTGDAGQKTWAAAKAKEYGISLTQPTPTPVATQPTPQPVIQQQPAFNPQTQMVEMAKYNQQMGEANFQQQKAQLDMMLESQIAQLKMAYDQAITDGQLSVRDAEAQFNEQKSAIEQQAYLDAERTGLYGQDMGIQNSQQMIGLMQGDDARKNSMINQNMTTRDKRVSDIKDRLNSIKTQKNLDLARVQAEHGAGLLGARASTNQQMAQNMFGLMQDDYKANREQNFARENIETQFQNGLKAMDKENSLVVGRMNLQQGFDLEKMNVSFKQQLETMAKQHGYNTQLEGMRQSGRLEEIRIQQENQLKMLDEQAKRARESLIATYTKGTPEYLAAERELELQTRSKASEIMSAKSAEAWTEIVFSNPNLPAYGAEATQEPHNYHANIRTDIPDWMKPLGNAQGNFMNWITGYDKKMNTYEAEQEAINAMNNYMGYGGINPMPWTQDPKPSSLERYLKKLQGK